MLILDAPCEKGECRRTGYSSEPATRGMLSSNILHPSAAG